MTAIVLLVIVATSVWLAYDASQRDWSRSGFANTWWNWLVGSLLLWIVVFPLYLFKRGSAPSKA